MNLVYHRQKVLLFVVLLVPLFDAVATSPTDKRVSSLAQAFRHPQPVEINGLPKGDSGTLISTEEPFLTRDGRFLFFNTGKKENNKDLHYAEWVGGTWLYRGEVGPGINNKKHVQGNPTMDESYNFFYVDSGVRRMVRMARFSPQNGSLSSVMDFDGVPMRKVKLFAQKVHGNMGVEVSADGSTVYFSRATWGMNGFAPGEVLDSDILFVEKQGDTYIFDQAEAKRIMKHINTSDLEYAASISSDRLNLYFTRLAAEDLKNRNIRSRIMWSTRAAVSDSFGKPEVIEAIGTSDFVEDPAISGDEKELYYHKYDGKKFRIYKVTR